MSYDLSDYVDVAERIRIFREKHPEGSLQSNFSFTDDAGKITGVVVCAHAYRTPDDARPGIGHSFCPIPGKTSFTKDSEIENAETSAWGRAIVAALAADTRKGVASADEVRAKVSPDGAAGSNEPPSRSPAAPTHSGAAPTEKQLGYLRRLMKEKDVTDLGIPFEQLTKAECSKFIEQLKDGSFFALKEFAEVGATLVGDEDIPF